MSLNVKNSAVGAAAVVALLGMGGQQALAAGKATVSGVSPTVATQGAATQFTISGQNLPSTLAFTIADAPCDKLGTNKFTCNPQAAGKKEYLVKDKSGGTVLARGNITIAVSAKVTGVSPTSAPLGVATTFTVEGQNLPSTLAFSIYDANCDALGNAKFRCSPQKAGSKETIVKDKSGGNRLYSLNVNVTQPQSSSTPNFSSPGYSSAVNPLVRAGYDGQCTAFAWGRSYEVTGKQMDVASNAKTWWSNTRIAKGSAPRPRSIAVWGGDTKNPAGHVAFVEEVRANGDIVINEANIKTFRDTKKGGGYDGAPKTLSASTVKNRGNAIGPLLGFIYIGG